MALDRRLGWGAGVDCGKVTDDARNQHAEQQKIKNNSHCDFSTQAPSGN